MAGIWPVKINHPFCCASTMPLIDMVPAKVTIVMIERPIDNS